MDKGSRIVALIALTIVFIASLWTVDVSVSAMDVSAGAPGGAKLTNGFWTRSPVVTYHGGLWTAVGAFFSVTAVAVNNIVENRGEDSA